MLIMQLQHFKDERYLPCEQFKFQRILLIDCADFLLMNIYLKVNPYG